MRIKIMSPTLLKKENKSNWYKLPSPVDLGWSEDDALEDAEWSDEPKGKTWQDWHAHVKKYYPVKYFFIETFPTWFRYKIWWPIKRPLENTHYWLVSHLVPSRRHHMLDLRQKGGYRYGWHDVPEKMLYAMFNLLGEYLKENPTDLTKWYSLEEINNNEAYKDQQDHLNESKAIYYWWTITRLEEHKARDDMQHLWWVAKKAKDAKMEEYWAQMQKIDNDNEAKLDEMIARLMKIRRTLWT